MPKSLVKSMSREYSILTIAVLLCWGLVSCGSTSSPSRSEGESEGEVSIAIPLSKRAAANISTAEIVVTGTGMAEIRQSLAISGNSLTGTVQGIPTGVNRLFTINGYSSSGGLTYTGSASATVTAGQAVTVSITVRSTTSTGVPILSLGSSASAQRTDDSDYVAYDTTITGEIQNTGSADASGVVIRFRARNEDGSPIGDATADVGTVGQGQGASVLYSATFTNTDYFDHQTRYVSQADFTITFNEGSDITGVISVQ